MNGGDEQEDRHRPEQPGEAEEEPQMGERRQPENGRHHPALHRPIRPSHQDTAEDEGGQRQDQQSERDLQKEVRRLEEIRHGYRAGPGLWATTVRRYPKRPGQRQRVSRNWKGASSRGVSR